MFTSAFTFNCSSSAGSKFGFGEVEKGGETVICKRDWFSWTTLCCEVLKCNSRYCACVLCPVKYDPNVALLSDPEKSRALRDEWRCANTWCDSILGVLVWLMPVLLSVSSSSFSQEALEHLLLFLLLVILKSRELSTVKCSSKKGKTIKSRNFNERESKYHGWAGSMGAPGSSVNTSNS